MATNGKAFVVDDDAAVRDSLLTLLDIEGFDVGGYPTASAFLEAVDEETAGIVLLDVNLPDANGLDIQKRLADGYPHLVVIIVTGHGDVPMAVSAIHHGAADFVEKPFEGDIVMETIRRALTARSAPVVALAPDPAAQERLERLTPRERQVLEQLVIGNPNKVIAYELGISPRTVEVYRANVMDKMEAKNLSQLIRMALSLGLGDE